MPATNVPCPRPSPGELFGSVDRFTCWITRPPKSATLDASTPESTIAIVGAAKSDCVFDEPAERGAFQTLSIPVFVVQSCLDENEPVGCAGASGVIVRPGIFAS